MLSVELTSSCGHCHLFRDTIIEKSFLDGLKERGAPDRTLFGDLDKIISLSQENNSYYLVIMT